MPPELPQSLSNYYISTCSKSVCRYRNVVLDSATLSRILIKSINYSDVEGVVKPLLDATTH